MRSAWAIARFAVAAALSAGRRGRVFSCLWELTYRCNARCAICPHWRKDGSQPPEEMTAGEIRAGLALLHRHGLRAVNFTGGEPLLRPDVDDAIACASQLGMWTSLVTNGSLLTRERLHDLRAAGLDNLLVSLDSASPEVHDRHRGVPGLHARVLAALDWMRDDFLRGHRTGGVMSVIAAHNRDEIVAILELARRRGVFAVLQPYHHNKTGDPSLGAAVTPESAACLRREMRPGGVLLSSSRYLDGLLAGRPACPGPACAAGRTYLSVDPYGYVHPCVDMPAAGRLLADGLAKLTSPSARQSVARCPGCWYCFRGEGDGVLSMAGRIDKAALVCRVAAAGWKRRRSRSASGGW